jgi:hypothetical protein
MKTWLLLIIFVALLRPLPAAPPGCRAVELHNVDDNFGYYSYDHPLCGIVLDGQATIVLSVGVDAHTDEFSVEWVGDRMVLVADLGEKTFDWGEVFIRESYPVFLPEVMQ